MDEPSIKKQLHPTGYSSAYKYYKALKDKMLNDVADEFMQRAGYKNQEIIDTIDSLDKEIIKAAGSNV